MTAPKIATATPVLGTATAMRLASCWPQTAYNHRRRRRGGLEKLEKMLAKYKEILKLQ
jgi:hypothetical protein